MHTGESVPVVEETVTMHAALLEMTSKGLGMTAIVNSRGNLVGIYTDGDLRRSLNKGVDIYGANIKDVMTPNPEVVRTYDRITKAVSIFRERRYGALPVLDKTGSLVGILSAQDLLLFGQSIGCLHLRQIVDHFLNQPGIFLLKFVAAAAQKFNHGVHAISLNPVFAHGQFNEFFNFFAVGTG